MNRAVLRAAAAAALAVALAGAPAASAAERPSPGDRLHIQFQGPLAVAPSARVVEIDGEEATAPQIAALQSDGRLVSCYTSAGSVEDWRADASAFPAASVGAELDGWPGERWLDIRDPAVLAVLRVRLQSLAEKGCQLVELDNVDGYDNDTGFPVTKADQIAFDRSLARAAREAGLSPGLKNATGLIRALASDFDWALNEECVTYRECSAYRPFVKARKAVFVLEYGEVPLSKVCSVAKRNGLSAQIAHLSLDGVSRHC